MRVWQHNTPHTTAICGPLSSVQPQPHSLCRSYSDMDNTAGTRRPGLAGRVVWENSNNDQDQAGRGPGPGTGRGSSQQGADVTLISGDFLQYLLIFHLADHTHADIPDQPGYNQSCRGLTRCRYRCCPNIFPCLDKQRTPERRDWATYYAPPPAMWWPTGWNVLSAWDTAT